MVSAAVIKHSKVATLPDHAGAEINKAEWNDDHVVESIGDATKYMDGTGQWSTPVGSGTVTHTGTLADHGVVVGNGGADVQTIAVGANNTVLRGATGADPAFGAVVEADLGLTDITTANVTSLAHGFAPKSPGNAAHFLNGANPPAFAQVTGSNLSLSDVTTNDVTSTQHGFAPKSPADATKFLNGAATPAYAAVKDSDLSTSDVTTNNVSSTKHGFTPKSPADATQFLNGAATPAFAAVKDSDLSTSDVTTNNASTTKHGFAPKYPNDSTKFLDGTGAYSVPPGTAAGGDATANLGYLNIPQNSKSTAYTTVLGDAGKHILHPSSDNNARTFTIDSNANVAYPIGTAITFINMVNTATIAITSDTLTLAGTGSTGSRTLAANGVATAIKIGSTSWIISGTGLT